MKTNTILKYVSSIIIIPLTAGSFALPHFMSAANSIPSVAAMHIAASAMAEPELNVKFGKAEPINPELKSVDDRAAKIDAYYRKFGLPLAGYGKVMVEAADKNGLDWRLIPAFAMIESTAGKFGCQSVPNNDFGWASCKVGFASREQAINAIAEHLAGNRSATAHYYAGKDTREIIETYNPPSIVPDYADKIFGVMHKIGETQVQLAVAS